MEIKRLLFWILGIVIFGIIALAITNTVRGQLTRVDNQLPQFPAQITISQAVAAPSEELKLSDAV